MDLISISLPEVTQTASKIRVYNTNIEDIIAYINRTMNELNTVWESEGSENLLNRFRVFASKFQDQSQTIEQYARFLDYTVSTYDSLESTITANGNNF